MYIIENPTVTLNFINFAPNYWTAKCHVILHERLSHRKFLR